jgi:hypothetical protein
MSREDILARMVRVRDSSPEPERDAPGHSDSQPAPTDNPLVPAPAPAAPDHSDYCSFSQPAPEPDCVIAWQPPALADHAPEPAALPAPVLLLDGVHFGRAPPAA